ncbi:DUF488 domain-containing protein [Geobacter sulfurreducens]|jgi:uncharacterized protein YeaO (DUF488 family)|uniref:Uroporphyrin-III methyltransferase n=1 Tax=Geobacter sulfurreducens (strain ATCC 51573 / DSM 12127 / PCA) TaxID=243231 RepID=Q746S6_GEOSL|nr:DUF488 domain-containing protein [Geobacter sulfurreducens]AAR36832.1 protein of unknown function DUF488 [Geobacter sulfurreducens PCA]ADI86198.1 protein of unknown function DUF488 [Geobacter sulfurreducens KN400]AJY69692.1 uroporphyrin-III methyltransferase [Geobacter sulfurreducens]QVW35251.1 DUF488 domain-containing protein [Geobacter sulfurreducens]UAC04088.1 DUF488 domain-containing protein [Geobacter sulfurreducens]
MVRVKRIYDEPATEDGTRVLVDRLWPRGIAKDKARIDEWLKEIAPSDELRQWFGHDPARWDEFRERYRRELDAKAELLDGLRKLAAGGTVTLLFAAKDEQHNNAVVLKDILVEQ